MKKILLLCCLAVLAGCASFSSPTNELRITEYGGGGGYLAIITGAIGGVRVIQEGDITACVEYHGQTATVRTTDCTVLGVDPDEGAPDISPQIDSGAVVVVHPHTE